jgi:hypothetical protein
MGAGSAVAVVTPEAVLPGEDRYQIEAYKQHWAVKDRDGTLICVTVYKVGAEEVVRRLLAAARQMPLDPDDPLMAKVLALAKPRPLVEVISAAIAALERPRDFLPIYRTYVADQLREMLDRTGFTPLPVTPPHRASPGS